MRRGWCAGVLVAAGAATLLAGCGGRATAPPPPGVAPSPVPEAVDAPPAACPQPPPSTAPPALPTPPGLTPDPLAEPPAAVAPSPPARGEALLEAAARQVAAAAAVRRALPAFDQLVASAVARSGVPGSAVAVIAGDTVMYERCSGVREVGRSDSVGPHTLFPLGAVSRAYTTTLLAVLVGEGELRWDQPVRTVWPGFRLRDRWASSEATFRDLTAGRSGLPAQAGMELRRFGYGRAEILRRLRHLDPVAGFRTESAPQDALVTAAAVAAARATGVSWERMVRERLLAPLGDRDTAVTRGGLLRSRDRVAPHRCEAGSMLAGRLPDESVFAPSLGVAASLRGVETFARLILNAGAVGGVRLAPDGAMAQTLTPAAAVASDGPTLLASSPGWTLSSFDDRLIATAEGGLESGTGAVVTLVPDDGVAVIVLANASPHGVWLGRALARTFIDLAVVGIPREDWVSREQAAAAPEERPRGLMLPPLPPAAAPPPRPRGACLGTYADRYYGEVRVGRAPGGGLAIRLGRGETLHYMPWSADVWREAVSGTAAVFDVRAGRARGVTLTLLSFDGRRGFFARVD